MTAALKVSVTTKADALVALRAALVEARPTERVCSEDGCSKSAHHVKGHYLVGQRWVRVWVCAGHSVGNPNTILPTPENLKRAAEIEQEQIAAAERFYRWRDGTPERSVSVKTLASTGFGKKVFGDRVENFRWEPRPSEIMARKGR